MIFDSYFRPLLFGNLTGEAPEIHETVKSIEETVGKAVNEPDVSPEIKSLLSHIDENPTRPFDVLRGEGIE